MSNVLKAIYNIKMKYDTQIDSVVHGSNRMNNMGDGLETYIKNAFASVSEMDDKETKISKYAQTFSYTGNKNNPPDMMLQGGDAVEVKKIESFSASLQLNSSHPKDKLYKSNSKLSKACINAENWREKDIIYVIGQVPKRTNVLKAVWFVMGDCYAANASTYTKVEEAVSNAIHKLPDLDFNLDTSEISGVRNVDPLEITFLRVRGMWIIKHPSKVFDHLYQQSTEDLFSMVAILRKDKYDSYPLEDRERLENDNEISVSDVNVCDPNNPSNLVPGVLITFSEPNATND